MKAETKEEREINTLICSDNFPKSVQTRLRSIRNLEPLTMHPNLGSSSTNYKALIGCWVSNAARRSMSQSRGQPRSLSNTAERTRI